MPKPQRPLRMLGSAVRPNAGAEFARLRRVDSALASRDPHPLVLGVAAVGGAAGASRLSALIAQRLEAIAPGRVGVLDGDTLVAPQRVLLGAVSSDGAPGLRQLLADPAAHRARRRIDAYVTNGAVPLLVAAERGEPLSVRELALAVQVFRHRYPVVVLDLPHGCGAAQLEWLSTHADHLVAVVPAATMAARGARDWLGPRVLGGSGPPSATIVASLVDRSAALVARAVENGVSDGAGAQLRWPDEPALRSLAPTGLDDISARARAVVDALTLRATASWPNREVLSTERNQVSTDRDIHY